MFKYVFICLFCFVNCYCAEREGFQPLALIAKTLGSANTCLDFKQDFTESEIVAKGISESLQEINEILRECYIESSNAQADEQMIKDFINCIFSKKDTLEKSINKLNDSIVALFPAPPVDGNGGDFSFLDCLEMVNNGLDEILLVYPEGANFSQFVFSDCFRVGIEISESWSRRLSRFCKNKETENIKIALDHLNQKVKSLHGKFSSFEKNQTVTYLEQMIERNTTIGLGDGKKLLSSLLPAVCENFYQICYNLKFLLLNLKN